MADVSLRWAPFVVVTSGPMEQEKAVESHVSSVLRKLHLSSRHQLARWAEQRRLV